MGSRNLAIFDLDGTLIRQDSLKPFLIRVAGAKRFWSSCVMAALSMPFARLTGAADARGGFKAALLARLLMGVTPDQAAEAGQEIADEVDILHEPLGALQRARKGGAVIVIATGALDCYVASFLDALDIHVDHIIATRMEMGEGGALTGRMAGPNNVRKAKAFAVAEWLATHGPFDHKAGWGNAPHDRAFLALMDESHIV